MGDFDTFPDLSLAAAGKIKRCPRVISQATLDFCPRALIDSIVPARSGRVLSRVGVESWLHDPDANRPRGTVALPTSMKGVRMDNFSVRSERNFHNLVVKPKRMHLLDEPSGYASAMVKSSLSHQMRFTVKKLERALRRRRPARAADQAARRQLARAVELEAVCRRQVRCGRIRRLCPRVLLRGSRGISEPVPQRRRGCRAAPVEPEGVRAAECRTWDCGGVGERTRHARPRQRCWQDCPCQTL